MKTWSLVFRNDGEFFDRRSSRSVVCGTPASHSPLLLTGWRADADPPTQGRLGASPCLLTLHMESEFPKWGFFLLFDRKSSPPLMDGRWSPLKLQPINHPVSACVISQRLKILFWKKKKCHLDSFGSSYVIMTWQHHKMTAPAGKIKYHALNWAFCLMLDFAFRIKCPL